jgi:hypothetical protein
MGDSKRFDLFAEYIARNFPVSKYKRVADIAGGQGYLQQALRKLSYDVTTFDKRHKHVKSNKIQYKFKYFDSSIKDDYDLLVGMHPDEATDIIIAEAIKRNIPFVVVPCCIKPTVTTFKGQQDYKAWVNHLKFFAMRQGYHVEEYQLKMAGKNILLKGSPKSASRR